MPWHSVALAGGAVVVAGVLVVVAGRASRARAATFDAEALAFVGGVLNALFIAIAAFYIVIAWQNSDSAAQRASAESAELVDLYWHAGDLPEPQRDRVRELVRDYTSAVIEREWPAMASGRDDISGAAVLASVRRQTGTAEPAARQAVERNLRVITDNRRERITQATNGDALLSALLIGTLAGGLLMIAFPLLMGISSGARHVTAIALLAAVIAMVGAVALELDQPFTGLVSVDPDAFRSAQHEFATITGTG